MSDYNTIKSNNDNSLKYSKDNVIIEISSKQNVTTTTNVVPPIKPKEIKK